MARLFNLFSLLWNIYTQSSLIGAVRYIKFKKMQTAHLDTSCLAERGCVKGIGIVGAGDYVATVHLPSLAHLSQPLFGITSKSLISAAKLAKVYKLKLILGGIDVMISDQNCDSILIATPHVLHAENIILSLKSMSYIYCEKPVAINGRSLKKLCLQTLDHANISKIMIGFNRRYAPAVSKLLDQRWIKNRTTPIEIHYRVNFGARVQNSMSDPLVGGGRLVGAGCHYVDLIAFIAGFPVVEVSAMAISDHDENSFSSLLKLQDGSLASLTFTSEGSRNFDSKEEIFISCNGHTARVVDFKYLKVDDKIYRFWRHTYGGLQTMKEFLHAKKHGLSVPIKLKDGIDATNVTLTIKKSIHKNGTALIVPKIY